MAGIPLSTALLVKDIGLGIAVSRLPGCFWTMDGLEMSDFFLEGSVLECRGNSDDLVMGLCSEKSTAHM